MVKEVDGNRGAVGSGWGGPRPVSKRVRHIVSPFFICPLRNVRLSSFSMTLYPFGLQHHRCRPVCCRDDDVAINWIVQGLEFVAFADGVDSRDKGLVIACVVGWLSRCTPEPPTCTTQLFTPPLTPIQPATHHHSLHTSPSMFLGHCVASVHVMSIEMKREVIGSATYARLC